MAESFDVVVRTPVGEVGLSTSDGVVTGVALALPSNSGPGRSPRNALARRAAEELEAFFDDPGHVFAVPVVAGNTPFQRRVLAALKRIPVGETRTYGDLARELKTSARAVGGACRANPCPIFIPCHRVVASDGGLGGFGGRRGGEWLAIKRELLRFESAAA